MFERAALARTGIWALPDSEVLYFVAEADDVGVPLDPGAAYVLRGTVQQPCRWWSVAVYRDYHFVDHPAQRYSYTLSSVSPGPDGCFAIVAGPQAHGGDWLPTGGPGARMTLLFRLYQPESTALDDPAAVPLPTVSRLP